MSPELPEIKIVRHVRAKHLRLRVEPNQVRLTVPLFCTKYQIQQFLDHSHDWLVETWQEQHQKQQGSPLDQQQIYFFNQQQPYRIIQRKQKKNYVIDHQLACIFIRDDKSYSVLREMIFDYAKVHLPAYLAETSQQTGLSFRHCAIRRPKTRWGSCSAHHDIMLHAGLVLMPVSVVRYVCIHELAHTRYFHHGATFWSEVEKYDSHHLQHRRQLKAFQLPAWWY